MKNMSPTRTPRKEAAPEIRTKNFEEVALGYTADEAKAEAARCLGCKNRPCTEGCPVSVKIPEFLALAAEGKFAEAYAVIRSTNSLPAVCGRVCPQETQCEGKCVRGIKGEPVAIGRLERFCADFARENAVFTTHGCPENKKTDENAPRVAVVGSGPAGLSCAGDLAAAGYSVTVFEALHAAGGVLIYGIPEFRLPKHIVAHEVDNLKKMGVTFATNTVVVRPVTVDELFADGYRAVFIGSGAGLPQFMGIAGEGLSGVYSANEYLTRVNLMKAYREDALTPILRAKRVAVVGGGNVAMDAARCAKRMGAEEVYIIYRRGEEEMPARREEIHHAKEEGIIFRLLTNPTEIKGDENGAVSAITVQKMALGEPDASGRRRPQPIEGSEEDIAVEAVIEAVGTRPNPLLRMTTPGLDSDRRGCLVVAEDGVSTTKAGVYAGGDAVTGAATVILAMGAGKQAAAKIKEFLGK
ncbi:MAG: NADPH-dependent glutamate synthase [Clostridia bacterium]|nr:NADPH-dependent glutamate synthase [Clostridia bacterium]